jgi:glutamate/tyrosine decarboxylase-like PLP-dependent enzyme
MIERIKALEEAARPLEPDAVARASLLGPVTEYVENFLESLHDDPAFRATEDQGAGILDAPISEHPRPTDEVLDLLKHHVDRPGVNVGSPGHMAFIPVCGLYASALGDYLASTTNRYAGAFFAAPGAVRIERMLLDWMAGFVGYPPAAMGDLTSGGSMANLIGIVTAREAHRIRSSEVERSVVYLSEQTHHSVEKALRIVGLGESVRRFIPLDGAHRLRADALDDAIRRDRDQGLLPWCVVANAGSPDTGAVDPLGDLADIAGQHGLWLHVDGAYGAMFALCKPGRMALRGIERSDSLVLDPHKGLFMPLGSGAVLVRDGRKLQEAHAYEASYMQDQKVLAPPQEISPADLSPELTRPFRGLRLWLALQLVGVAPFRAALEEKLLLARYFYGRMQEMEGFEVGGPPDLSIVPFRFVPGRGDPNEFNRRLSKAVQEDGRVFLSSTMIHEDFMLRLAVLGFRTHLDTVDAAIRILEGKAREIAQT